MDEYKNSGFFNLTKFSVQNVHRADEDYFDPNSGTFKSSILEDNSRAFGIETINGWFLFPFLSTGIGFGYNSYNAPDFNTFPVYLDLRAYFSDRRNSFYINFDFGTLLNFDNTYSKGQVVNAGIGYKFFIYEKICLFGGISANSKSFNRSGFSEPDPTHSFTINSISIDFGILF